MKLNNVLKGKFKSALDTYHRSLWNPSLSGEIDFIDRTVKGFQTLSRSSGNQSFKTRSKKIHLTPQAQFYRYGLLFPNVHTTVEMGDLLFIFKHFSNGSLDAHRGILVQVKYTKGKEKSWKIETDQFYFLTQWPKFRIVKPKFNKWYSTKPTALTWATYGFVGQYAVNYPVYYSSSRMLRTKRSVLSTKSFTFSIKTSIGWDSSTSYL